MDIKEFEIKLTVNTDNKKALEGLLQKFLDNLNDADIEVLTDAFKIIKEV